jgi:hypothetical protein
MVTDHGLRGAPPGQGLAKDLEPARELLPLEAAGPDNGPTVPIKDQDAIEPWPIDLDQRAHLPTPDLGRDRRLLGAFTRRREPCRLLGAGVGLFRQGHHLPHRRVALPLPQGVQRHLHAVVPQQGMVVQHLEDLPQGLDRDPRRQGGARTAPRGQADHAQGGKAPVPGVDDGGLDGQELCHTPRAKADLQELHDPPAGLLRGGILAIRPTPQEQMVGAQGLGQTLGVGGRLEGQGPLLASRERRPVGPLEGLIMPRQHVRGAVMEVKHPPDAALIRGDGVTGLDNPREFTGGEGMRQGQADNLLLDVDGSLGFARRPPASVLEGASIQQTVEAIAPTPRQIPPQALIRPSSAVALLSEGTLAW